MILILHSILHYVNIKLKFFAREKYVKLKLAVLEKKILLNLASSYPQFSRSRNIEIVLLFDAKSISLY